MVLRCGTEKQKRILSRVQHSQTQSAWLRSQSPCQKRCVTSSRRSITPSILWSSREEKRRSPFEYIPPNHQDQFGKYVLSSQVFLCGSSVDDSVSSLDHRAGVQKNTDVARDSQHVIGMPELANRATTCYSYTVETARQTSKS